MLGLPPSIVIVPEPLVKPTKKLLDAYGALDGNTLPCSIVPLIPGTAYAYLGTASAHLSARHRLWMAHGSCKACAALQAITLPCSVIPSAPGTTLFHDCILASRCTVQLGANWGCTVSVGIPDIVLGKPIMCRCSESHVEDL